MVWLTLKYKTKNTKVTSITNTDDSNVIMKVSTEYYNNMSLAIRYIMKKLFKLL